MEHVYVNGRTPTISWIHSVPLRPFACYEEQQLRLQTSCLSVGFAIEYRSTVPCPLLGADDPARLSRCVTTAWIPLPWSLSSVPRFVRPTWFHNCTVFADRRSGRASPVHPFFDESTAVGSSNARASDPSLSFVSFPTVSIGSFSFHRSDFRVSILRSEEAIVLI